MASRAGKGAPVKKVLETAAEEKNAQIFHPVAADRVRISQGTGGPSASASRFRVLNVKAFGTA